jgi:hypothetical protein
MALLIHRTISYSPRLWNDTAQTTETVDELSHGTAQANDRPLSDAKLALTESKALVEPV